MGAFLSAIKDQAGQAGQEQHAKANDALNALIGVAKTRQALFKAKIEDPSANPLLLPILHSIQLSSLIRANVTVDSDSVSQGIEGTPDFTS